MPFNFSKEDLREVRPLIEKISNKLLGDVDSTILKAAERCLRKDYDKIKATEYMKVHLKDEAAKFVDKLYGRLETVLQDDLRRKKRFSENPKRKHGDNDEETSNMNNADVKKSKLGDENGESAKSEDMTMAQIKEMMTQAKQQITAKKDALMQKELERDAMTADSAYKDALVKARRAAELQCRIQATLTKSKSVMQAVSGLPVATPQAAPTENYSYNLALVKGPRPPQVVMDTSGRITDLSGREFSIPSRTPELKANVRAQRREEFKKEFSKQEPTLSTETASYCDERLIPKPPARPKKAFLFHERGKYVEIGKRLRTKAQLEKLQSEISQAAKKTGIQSAAKLALLIPALTSVNDRISLDIEWWDDVIQGEDGALNGISNLIEHPAQLKPPVEKDDNFIIPTYLTKKETRKLRRQKRSEKLKEFQEKQKLGLEPPPEPKVKLSNLMRVLGSDAVHDPTKVEVYVRAQMAKRQRTHNQANLARKLTKQQVAEKKVKKLKDDTSSGIEVSLYRIKHLSNPSHKFKVETNCKQLHMTGCVVLFKDVNLVVVEGGPRQHNKFHRLMMHRIQWTDHSQDNVCQLVWKGTVKDRAFGEMKFKSCPVEAVARSHFRKYGVEQYWDLAHSQAVIDSAVKS